MAQAVYATQGVPLRAQLKSLLDAEPTEELGSAVYAVIVPDSNLLDGGQVSAKVFSKLGGQRFRNVIVIEPSHAGGFKRINVCSLDVYQTPLGELTVSGIMREELCDEDDDIFVGDQGHFHPSGAHAQLPFLQMVLDDDFEVVPIVMGEETPDMCRELGHAVGEISYNRATLVVACANITAAAEGALDEFRTRLAEKDVSGLMQLLNREIVEIEGKGAVLVALLAALHRRATDLEIVQITEPFNGTPGFIGAVISR